jgi:hypothetical protein
MHADDSLHAEITSRLNALIDAAPVPRRSLLETTLEPHRELITRAHAKGHNGDATNGKPNRSSRKVTARKKTSAKG